MCGGILGEQVYSVIDCLHVTGFIQSIFGILVRGEINSSISPRQLLNGNSYQGILAI